ncbi:hypothetical protein ACFJGX_19650 [Hydrogenophaga sp. UC242_50]|uniref:hypothetical protein n=1 Tax=Hydrogenophaga sp. UC242_50 TaxID=3350169 RepID=UPI0036D422C0
MLIGHTDPHVAVGADLQALYLIAPGVGVDVGPGHFAEQLEFDGAAGQRARNLVRVQLGGLLDTGARALFQFLGHDDLGQQQRENQQHQGHHRGQQRQYPGQNSVAGCSGRQGAPSSFGWRPASVSELARSFV